MYCIITYDFSQEETLQLNELCKKNQLISVKMIDYSAVNW
jgi:hypothetical protein